MSGDGVSMPTTLSQMGRVAKTQAKGQHHGQQVTPFGEQQEKRDELKIQKVQEAKEAAQKRVEADPDEQDKRKRRRQARRDKSLAREDGLEGQPDDQPPDNEADGEALGVTIDLLA